MMILAIFRGNVYPGVFLLGLVVVVVIWMVSSYFSRKAVVKRNLRLADGKRIGSFINGEHGKITGKVSAVGKTLKAPLSKRDCVYYHVIVQEYRSGGKSGHWYTIIDDVGAGDIVMTDGRHYAVVEVTRAKAYIVTDQNYSSGMFNDATPELEEFLAKHGYDSTTFLGFNRKLRYLEGVLEHDEKFAVCGIGYWRASVPLQIEVPLQRVLVIQADERESVYFSDDPEVVK